MCTGRYDLLSTSTFELRTDIPAVAPAGYRRVGPLSIFLSLSAGLHWRSPTQHGVPRSPRLVQAAEPRVVRRFPHARRVVGGLAGDRDHRLGEGVERLLA